MRSSAAKAIILSLMILYNSGCGKEAASFDCSCAYTIKDFWLNLDRCAGKDIVISGTVIWISPDRKTFDIHDGNENVTVNFGSAAFTRGLSKGSFVYVSGFVDCAQVQRGKLDRFVHNASIRGYRVMRKGKQHIGNYRE